MYKEPPFTVKETIINMGIIIIILIVTVSLLFIFPLLLGYDIKKETKNEEIESNEEIE